MPLKETFDLLLKGLQNNKGSFIDMENTIISIKDSHFKKNPKSLDTFITKEMLTKTDSLSLILKGQLYIEVLLNDIIETEIGCECNTQKELYELLDSTFHNKISFLHKKGLLDDVLYNDIDAINRYRNKFAHHFEYNICSLTPFNDFSLFKDIQIKQKRKKVENEALFRFAMRFAFMHIYSSLYHKFDYLLALKRGNKRASFHPLESNNN